MTWLESSMVCMMGSNTRVTISSRRKLEVYSRRPYAHHRRHATPHLHGCGRPCRHHAVTLYNHSNQTQTGKGITTAQGGRAHLRIAIQNHHRLLQRRQFVPCFHHAVPLKPVHQFSHVVRHVIDCDHAFNHGGCHQIVEARCRREEHQVGENLFSRAARKGEDGRWTHVYSEHICSVQQRSLNLSEKATPLCAERGRQEANIKSTCHARTCSTIAMSTELSFKTSKYPPGMSRICL